MRRFALCDDCREDLTHIARLLPACLDAGGLETVRHIDVFSSGEELLAHANPADRYDVYFIDVLMGAMSGIETARRLNQCPGKGVFDIVFTTNSTDFAVDAFDVRAADYLVKPIDRDKLCRALSRCRALTVRNADLACVTITKSKRDFRLVKREILYIESFAHICVFHSDGRDLNTYMSLDAVIKLLDDRAFVRCHKSYIVNLEHVRSINGDYLVLQNGASVPVGRAMRREIYEMYDDYLIGKVWEKRRND